MTEFQRMFIKSKGKPIEYKGNFLYMADELPMSGSHFFKVVIEETNSDWKQGIRLRCDTSFIFEGRNYGPQIVLWENTAPPSVTINVEPVVNIIEVNNIWDTGNGVTHSWHNGAAMILEDIPNGRRYRCNDGKADDDFNDIIFRIELLTDHQT